MNMIENSKSRGFTLIEMAMVLVLSGLVLSVCLGAYSNYLESKRYRDTREGLDAVKAAILAYANKQKRYPCPSDPALDFEDVNSGVENCSLLPAATPVGTCAGGICKAAGARDTEADGDALPDSILVGAVPYKTLNSIIGGAGEHDILKRTMARMRTVDSWGGQMSYAVTASMTQVGTFNPSFGVIAVRKEDGGTLIQPTGGAHYIIVSHGNDGVGSYTTHGVQAQPCAGSPLEVENCNGDGVFINGLRATNAGATYFDDLMVYETYIISSLWDYSGVTGHENDLYNLNTGNVGIGIPLPAQKLDVNGNARGNKIKSQQLCDSGGAATDCFAPDILGGPVGIVCPPTGVPNTVRLVTGIANNDVVCSAPIALPSSFAGQNCATPGEYMVGVNSLGNIICKTP